MGKISLLLMISSGLAAGGCAWRGYAGEVEDRPYTDRIVFSGDGRQTAYVWTDRCWSLIPFPPAMPMDTLAEAKTEWVGWCTPDGANHLVRVDGRTRCGGGFGNSRSICALAFSPDGRRLAAVLADRIVVIDTADGSARRMPSPGGELTGAAWFDDARLVFATTRADRAPPGAVVVRSIYRQAVDGGEPVGVFSRTSRRSSHVAFRASWAPDGRTALLTEGRELWRVDLADGEATRLLHLAPPAGSAPSDRRPRVFGDDGSAWGADANWDIHWKPDGREVAVLASDAIGADLLLAGVFDCRSWRFTDLKAAFRRDLGPKWVLPISWTPDGLLLVRCAKPGRWAISLVQCRPWRVTPLPEPPGGEFPVNDSGRQVVQPLTHGWRSARDGRTRCCMPWTTAARRRSPSPDTPSPSPATGGGSRKSRARGA